MLCLEIVVILSHKHIWKGYPKLGSFAKVHELMN